MSLKSWDWQCSHHRPLSLTQDTTDAPERVKEQNPHDFPQAVSQGQGEANSHLPAVSQPLGSPPCSGVQREKERGIETDLWEGACKRLIQPGVVAMHHEALGGGGHPEGQRDEMNSLTDEAKELDPTGHGSCLHPTSSHSDREG